jgi:hypothetical protein
MVLNAHWYLEMIGGFRDGDIALPWRVFLRSDTHPEYDRFGLGYGRAAGRQRWSQARREPGTCTDDEWRMQIIGGWRRCCKAHPRSHVPMSCFFALWRSKHYVTGLGIHAISDGQEGSSVLHNAMN